MVLSSLPAARRVAVLGRNHVDSAAWHMVDAFQAAGGEAQLVEARIALSAYARLKGKARSVVDLLFRLSEDVPQLRARRFARILHDIARLNPTFVLASKDFLRPEEVAEVRRRTGAPVALWYPDTIANVGRGDFLRAPYDAVFLKDPFMVRAYRDLALAPVHYLPEAFNPRHHRVPAGWTGPDPRYACDVTTAGNMHAIRAALFRHLADVDVKIWGTAMPVWLDEPSVRAAMQNHYVINEEKAVAFRSAKIVLNSQHPSELEGVNARTFEVCGIGAFQLTNARAGLGRYFEPGVEVAVFSGVEEMRSQVARYVVDGSSRRRISEAGWRRAHADHTFDARLLEMVSVLEGRADPRTLPAPLAATPA